MIQCRTRKRSRTSKGAFSHRRRKFLALGHPYGSVDLRELPFARFPLQYARQTQGQFPTSAINFSLHKSIWKVAMDLVLFRLDYSLVRIP